MKTKPQLFLSAKKKTPAKKVAAKKAPAKAAAKKKREVKPDEEIKTIMANFRKGLKRVGIQPRAKLKLTAGGAEVAALEAPAVAVSDAEKEARLEAIWKCVVRGL